MNSEDKFNYHCDKVRKLIQKKLLSSNKSKDNVSKITRITYDI